MHKFGFIPMLLSLLLCGSTEVLASPSSSLFSRMPEYELVDASWRVQLVPGGPTITLNGTIQQVKAQLAVSNPGWKLETSEVFTAEGPAAAGFPVRFKEAWHWCGKRHKDSKGHELTSAFYDRITEGVEYLRHTGGAGVGAKKCARISCSWGSAIGWCNDNNFELRFPTSNPLIEAIASLDRPPCVFYYDINTLILGRVHTPDLWNILISHDDC